MLPTPPGLTGSAHGNPTFDVDQLDAGEAATIARAASEEQHKQADQQLSAAAHLAAQAGNDGGDAQAQQAIGKSLTEFQAALAQQHEQNTSNTTAALGFQRQLSEYLGNSLKALQDNITESRSQAEATQMQTIMANISNLFAGYEARNRDMREQLAAAQPTEVVVDVSQQMATDSDEIVRQLIEQIDQLQAAEQQPPPPSPEQPPPPEAG